MTLAWAQEPPPPGGPGAPPPPGAQGAAPGQDVPGRAARLGLVTGTVSFQPGSVDDWVPATPNRPLTTGDRLWTDTGGRAEVHLGSAAFRLNARTNFSFINLDDRMAQVQLSMGTLNIRVRRLADDETVEIDTPQAALTILRPGEYRVDVTEQGDASIVTVRSGQIEATAGQAVAIHPREQLRIMNGPSEGAPATFDQREAPIPDPFDNFCMDRDRREDMSQSARYVSRDMPGYADLDAAGQWRPTPEYGNVWYPGNVQPGWAPYRFGHWAWVAPWGWTWVDDAPWGYAPFHYGRWVFAGGGWGWVPGPMGGPGIVVARPVYAPALVAWVGGPSFGVSIGIGGGAAVGWFALGPREVFVPAYAYSPAYIERVNVTNTVIVNRGVFVNANVGGAVYMNRGVAGAVVAVPAGAMVAGRPIGVAAVVVRPEVMARVQVTNVVAVVPERGAVVGGRVVTNVAPPAMAMNRTVVTRAAPPPAPVAFEQQRAAIAANPERPFNNGAIRASAPAPAARPMYRPAAVGGAPANPGSRPFTPANTSPRPEPMARPATSNAPTPAARPNPESRPNAEARPAEHGTTPPPAHNQKQTKDTRSKRTDKEKEKQ